MLFLGHFLCIKSTSTFGNPPPGSTTASTETDVLPPPSTLLKDHFVPGVLALMQFLQIFKSSEVPRGTDL